MYYEGYFGKLSGLRNGNPKYNTGGITVRLEVVRGKNTMPRPVMDGPARDSPGTPAIGPGR